VCGNRSIAGRNFTLRVEISVVRVKITLVGVEITLVRVKITFVGVVIAAFFSLLFLLEFLPVYCLRRRKIWLSKSIDFKKSQ
jgi:hypothetical protein